MRREGRPTGRAAKRADEEKRASIPWDKKWPSRFNCLLRLGSGIGHKRICRINKMGKKGLE